MHLRIMSAESDNITYRKLNSCMSGEFRKEKHNFSQLAFVYIWQPVEVAQMTAEMKTVTHSLRVVAAQRKKSLTPAGLAINAYGWNVKFAVSFSVDKRVTCTF